MIGETARHAFEQAYPARPIAQYQDTGVRRDLAAIEGGEHHPFAVMRIPMKAATDSDGKRPPVPIQNGHFGRGSNWAS